MLYVKEYLNRGLALFLAVSLLASCTLESAGPGKADDQALVSNVSRLLEENLSLVREYIKDDLDEEQLKMLDDSALTGETIATKALEESDGRDYLEFTLTASNYDSVEEVLASAKGLASEEDLEKVREQLEEMETKLMEEGEVFAKALTPTQKREFYKDLRKLVVKSAVLLTAAIVYACVPKLVLWGKVAAASAVAIAAGVLALTVMSVVQYYELGTTDTGESFEDWLTEVTAEPTADWAIASAMISTSSAMGHSPILTALILAVFTLYNVIDDVKPMLEKYNFKA